MSGVLVEVELQMSIGAKSEEDAVQGLLQEFADRGYTCRGVAVERPQLYAGQRKGPWWVAEGSGTKYVDHPYNGSPRDPGKAGH